MSIDDNGVLVQPLEHDTVPNGMQPFKFPDEEPTPPEPVALEIEIEDDTPPQDRGREPMPADVVESLESDDLSEYSDRAQKRIKQLRKVWHDERRDKEAAARERAEAVRAAQALLEENRRLRQTYSQGEQLLVQTAEYAAKADLAMAQREYRDAYDAGDTDKVLEAQQKIADANLRLDKIKNYQPSALQTPESGVNIQQQAPAIPEVSQKTQEWMQKNPWFGFGKGHNRVMTSLAMGVHEQLIEEGVVPDTDDYFSRIESAVRRRFPEQFKDSTQTPPAPQATPSVVAPVSRGTAPQRVKLTASQVAFARKCGLTPEQYAKEVLKLGGSNV